MSWFFIKLGNNSKNPEIISDKVQQPQGKTNNLEKQLLKH